MLKLVCMFSSNCASLSVLNLECPRLLTLSLHVSCFLPCPFGTLWHSWSYSVDLCYSWSVKLVLGMFRKSLALFDDLCPLLVFNLVIWSCLDRSNTHFNSWCTFTHWRFVYLFVYSQGCGIEFQMLEVALQGCTILKSLDLRNCTKVWYKTSFLVVS